MSVGATAVCMEVADKNKNSNRHFLTTMLLVLCGAFLGYNLKPDDHW